MGDKMAAYQFAFTSVRCCGHSNSVIFNQISSKFQICISSIKFSFFLKYWFCSMNDNQDGRQMAAADVYTVMVTLTRSFLIRFLHIQLFSKIFTDSDFCHNYFHTLYLFECL